MLIRTHLIVTSILCVVILPVYGFNSLYLFIGCVFVDIDHLFLFILRTGSLDVKGAYRYFLGRYYAFRRTGFSRRIYDPYIFHSIEILTLLLALSFISQAAFIALAGVVLHIMMDLLSQLWFTGKTNFPRSVIFYLIA